jgi:hypothetical protein
LLVAIGRVSEGKQLLEAYARQPFNAAIHEKLIRRLGVTRP